MLKEHRIGVRVKRHRDLRHDAILDFIDSLPRDENTNEIAKTVLSNHVFNALYLYVRAINKEIQIVEKHETDILTSLAMQSFAGNPVKLSSPSHATINTPAEIAIPTHQEPDTVQPDVIDEKPPEPEVKKVRPRFNRTMGSS